MNVVFVTRRQHNISSKIPILTPEQGRTLFQTWETYSTVYHDIETTGGDPYKAQLLLEAWYTGDPNHPILVIDSTSVSPEEVVSNEDLENREVVAHNADFEARWNLLRGLTSGNYYCTMVADQIILSGSSKIRFSLVETLKRRGISLPEEMDKSIRDEFINANRQMVFEDRHIFYNAGDVTKLRELKEKQQRIIDSLKINFLVHRLRMPLVKILAQGELTGFVHDTETWLTIARKREAQALIYTTELDNYLLSKGLNLLDLNPQLKKLYEQDAKNKERLRLRIEKIYKELDRLESRGKTETRAYVKLKQSLEKCEGTAEKILPPITINWSSPQQPLEIMKVLGIKLPEALDAKTYKIKPGVGKAARTNWFAEFTEHEHMVFMKKFDQFKKIEHNIKSFGEGWVEKYLNPVSRKVHTIFRQAGTKTLRFASGDKRKGYFNLQQIPKEENEHKRAEYRECFRTDPGRKMATLDYTGCEIVCMISLSKDLILKRISELPDQHSYMGTKCWRAVYQNKYNKTNDPKWLELAQTYTMGKGKERDKFKASGVFPVIYGVKPPKVASIQGFSQEDGKIFIDTIEAEMPNVVKYVKDCAAHAVTHGFVLHNTRTNSRRWFQSVLDQEATGYLSQREQGKIETAARNSPVQGTNVDIITEAMVFIYRWARLYRLDIRFLGQVHDELIYDFPEDQEWIAEKLRQLMCNAAKRYLIDEISMDAECKVGYSWLK